MRFHLQNVVECHILQETLQIILLMLIMCVCACTSLINGYQYEFNDSTMMDSRAALSSSLSSSSSSASSEISTISLQQKQQLLRSTPTASAAPLQTSPNNNDNNNNAMKFSSTISTYDFIYSADYFYAAATPMSPVVKPTIQSATVDENVATVEFNTNLYTKLPPAFEEISQKQTTQVTSSKKTAASIIEISNDSNEIDSQDYVMAEHIASHDDNEQNEAEAEEMSNHNEYNVGDENRDDDDDIDEDDDDEDDEVVASHAATFVMATESTPFQSPQQQQQQRHTHAQLMGSLTSISTQHTQQLPLQQQQQQQQHLTNNHLNKTQDLSSLSLLSFNDENNENENAAASADAGATLQKRLVEHQKNSQQQQRFNSRSTAITTTNNNKNSGRSKNSNSNSNNNDPNDLKSSTLNGSTTTNFQHIGSQRITLRAPITSADAAAFAATIATIANSSSNFNNGNTKTSNSKTANGQTISSSSVTAAAGGAASGTAGAGAMIGARKVESKYILPKPQKTDAPMLNYIFDTFSSANKHHHHDQRYGPHFEDVERLGQPTNMTVQAGSSIHLNCRISLLQDKTVSWVRRNVHGENALDLLTVGPHTYTGDKRYKLEFQYPNNWRLKITNVKKDDEASYECQISTHPPRVIQINLHVNAPKVMIVDEFGDPLQEKYYEIDSTLQLSCVVRNVAMTNSVVYWKHSEDVLNYDVTRGGVSVKTELMEDGANSTLSIAKIHKVDSGNYTCSINEFQNFTIIVHILNGESFAELHHGGAAAISLQFYHHTLAINFTLLILLLCLPASCIQR